MHDDTTEGQAIADRALAYWKDPANFPNYNPRRMGRILPVETRDEIYVPEPIQQPEVVQRRRWIATGWFMGQQQMRMQQF